LIQSPDRSAVVIDDQRRQDRGRNRQTAANWLGPVCGQSASVVRPDRLYGSAHPGFADVAIAAIAKSRELAVVTLNLRHFEPIAVDTFNPFEPG
jgi:predicted nucleic acid-binding protein